MLLFLPIWVGGDGGSATSSSVPLEFFGSLDASQPVGFRPRPRGDARSLADRVHGEQPETVDVEALHSPLMEGEMLTITLPKAAVERGKLFCQFSLIGRLDFGKVLIVRARTITAKIWKPTGEWKLILLGNGYFMLKLDSRDDYICIWSQYWRVGDQ